MFFNGSSKIECHYQLFSVDCQVSVVTLLMHGQSQSDCFGLDVLIVLQLQFFQNQLQFSFVGKRFHVLSSTLFIVPILAFYQEISQSVVSLCLDCCVYGIMNLHKNTSLVCYLLKNGCIQQNFQCFQKISSPTRNGILQHYLARFQYNTTNL